MTHALINGGGTQISGWSRRAVPGRHHNPNPADRQKWIKVTDHEMEQLPIVQHEFHGDGHYTIKKSPEEFEGESD